VTTASALLPFCATWRALGLDKKFVIGPDQDNCFKIMCFFISKFKKAYQSWQRAFEVTGPGIITGRRNFRGFLSCI
jgi:hypothetical protein